MTKYWKDANGTKWKVCSCLAKWLPAYQNELLRVGIIKRGLDVFQTIGGAPDSAGYHLFGGNVDTGQTSPQAIRIARNMGGAAFPRDSRDGMSVHCHIVLKGCPHVKSGPRWQVTELEGGRNGLVNRKADRGPRDGIKWPLRTYTEGIAWAKAQVPPKPPKPPTTKVVRWHGAAFLNVKGDDSEGKATITTRLPQMAADVTEGKPEVVGMCELRPEQESAMTKAMKAKGYKLAAYSHRLALYVLAGVVVGKTSFYQYAKQNAGAIEGMLRVRLAVNGSLVNYGITHLDYRPGFDAGRVTQMKQGVRSLMRFGIVSWPLTWQSRTAILTDANSEDWVTDKAIIPAGFKIATRAVIDFIYVGKSRPVISGEIRKTKSDHPIVEAVIGKTVKI